MFKCMGKELEKFISDMVDEGWEKRDFVSLAENYYGDCRFGYIFAVCGLWGTGKTVGLLQSLREKDMKSSLYVCADMSREDTAEECISFIRGYEDVLENIVIDEYAWFRDREKLDAYIYGLVQDGKKISVTGTEAITIAYLNRGNLIHRMLCTHTTCMSYPEYCRIYGLPADRATCDDYLLKGGIFGSCIGGVGAIEEYVKTAIIKPLCEYMEGKLSEQKATDLVYAFLYETVGDKSPKASLEPEEKRLVGDLLTEVGVTIKVPNFLNRYDEYRYYITNPSLCTQLYIMVYGEVLTDSQRGRIFEAACAAHMSQHLCQEDELFFLKPDSGDGCELNFVITQMSMERVYLCECKYQNDMGMKPDSVILRDEVEGYFDEAEMCRYVIYTGEPGYSIYTNSNGNKKEMLLVPLGEK